MNTSNPCDRTLLVQAEFDGELNAGQVAELIDHRAHCDHCRSVYAQLNRARSLLRVAPRYTAPDSLRRVLQKKAYGRTTTQKQSRSLLSSSWKLGIGIAATLIVAVVISTMSRWSRSPDLSAQLVANHLRAMQLPSHLIDVASSDHHTVKPWFAGKVEFAPPIKELGAFGYELKGGRVDIVDGRTAAVLVYQAGRHTVDLVMWPTREGNDAPIQSRDGFNLRRWEDHDLTLLCISDMGADELSEFARRWQSEP